MRLTTRFILGWDTITLLYVGFTLLMMTNSTMETCQQRAALYDEGDWVILLVVVASASTSFVAIFAELASSPAWRPGARHCADRWDGGAVLDLHAHGLHAALRQRLLQTGRGRTGRAHFPGHRPPDYRDFLYYAFVIGCACQTGDVATISHAMRRLTLVHGIIAFAFNTAILALMINVGASLIH